LELKPKRFGGKGKKNIVATTQHDLRFNSSDETLITTMGTQGTLSLHVNENYESHARTSYSNDPLVNE